MSATAETTLPGDVAQPTGEAKTISYRIDPSASRFTVQAFAEGLFSAFGHNPRFDTGELSGAVRMDQGDLATATLELLVKAASLRLADDLSEKDRVEIERVMHDEVLETSRYSEIIFQGQTESADRIYEGFYRVKIAGQLSLHGATRAHTIETQVRLLENGLRAEGESQLRQSDFGIKRVSVAGGTLKVKDEVKLAFNIVATAES
jgi:polyisoprenoid-binding protein YceI